MSELPQPGDAHEVEPSDHPCSASDYVPVDDIPLEWRPPEFSPRLKSYGEFPIEMLGTIAASLGRDNEYLTLAIGETAHRIAVCWTRLKDSYLEWFEPMGPPGLHMHIHYRSPQDPMRRSIVQSSMVVDYEAALVFLDVTFELTAQAIGTFVGRPLTWQKLLAEAEKPDADLEEWLHPDVARSIRHIQRTVLYARNKAIVHPGRHYVGLRTDNTGDVTYLRVPMETPDAHSLTRLEALLRSRYELREGLAVDPTIVETKGNAVPPWMVITWLDKVAGDLGDAERIELQELRELVGYSLPSIRDIAEVSDTFLSGIVQSFGDLALERREAQVDESAELPGPVDPPPHAV
ncbi:MAG TPA: hypothetical protein VFH56_09770 [Acidimicrobiales bacterium]|nr:hypothetical protein [Acidimicrobiales bacterium]